MLARSFGQPGDHLGQHSAGFRWPYGPTALITPFNFPLEIPLLQLMGALYMGNKVRSIGQLCLKSDHNLPCPIFGTNGDARAFSARIHMLTHVRLLVQLVHLVFPSSQPLLLLLPSPGSIFPPQVVLKGDSKNSIVMEQMLRLLHYCGMPMGDVDFFNSAQGASMHALLMEAQPRMTLFTGSSKVSYE